MKIDKFSKWEFKWEFIKKSITIFNEVYLELFDKDFDMGIYVGTSYTFVSISDVDSTLKYINQKIDEIDVYQGFEINIRSHKTNNKYESLKYFMENRKRLENRFEQESGLQIELTIVDIVGMDNDNTFFDPIDDQRILRDPIVKLDNEDWNFKMVYNIT